VVRKYLVQYGNIHTYLESAAQRKLHVPKRKCFAGESYISFIQLNTTASLRT
jgi:hypothetical protein